MNFGPFSFPTKKAAIEFDRSVRQSPPRVLRGEEFEWARTLLEHHPQAQKKIGCGVETIEVVQDGVNFKYEICRVDGSRSEFSVLKCFSGEPSRRLQVMSAFREAVRPQMEAFREALFSRVAVVRSAVSGSELAPDECHIDHHPTSFKQLVENFCASEKCLVDKLVVHNPEDLPSGYLEFQDLELAQRWAKYHQKHAVLRPVSAQENLRKPRV